MYVFSQVVSSKKYDFILSLPSYDSSHEHVRIQDSVPVSGLFNDSIYIKKFDSLEELLYPNRGEIPRNIDQENLRIIQNPQTVYSLRIIKPSGNYPIKIHEPDATKKHTLLRMEH